MTSPFRLVVFDLDGTLVDTRRDLADSANVLIAELGGEPLPVEVIGRMVGTGVRVWLAQALTMSGSTPFSNQALDRFITIYDERLLIHTKAYERMAEVLEQLAGRTELAVLTNKMRHATVKILEGLNLARFFTQIGGVDGPYPPKPAPDGIQAFMNFSGAKPHETVLVGDSPIDLQTARNAGTRICLARYGFGYVETPSAELKGDELFVNQPDELPALLNQTVDSQLK